jgi:hypothetical protein
MALRAVLVSLAVVARLWPVVVVVRVVRVALRMPLHSQAATVVLAKPAISRVTA